MLRCLGDILVMSKNDTPPAHNISVRNKEITKNKGANMPLPKSKTAKPAKPVPKTGSDLNREKELSATLDQIEKQFGAGAIMKMGDTTGMEIEVVPTGALPLDIALGIGGLPKGRVTEIFGPESSGKTTLALHAVAEAQKQGGVCAFVDAEHALDPIYAEAIGVNVNDLLVSQPDSGEQALEITDMLIRSSTLDMIVIDSVAALTPRAELEGDMGAAHVGLQARLMSQALRKLTANLSRSNTCCVFINQLREKVGVMFGSPETTPGGRALKFYSSVRLDIRRIESLKDGTDFIGSRTRVKVVKNKCAPPFKQAEFDIMYSQGISQEGALLDMAVELDVINKAGAWFTYGGEQLGQGRENSKLYLRDNPKVTAEVTEKVREAMKPAVPVVEEKPAPVAEDKEAKLVAEDSTAEKVGVENAVVDKVAPAADKTAADKTVVDKTAADKTAAPKATENKNGKPPAKAELPTKAEPPAKDKPVAEEKQAKAKANAA